MVSIGTALEGRVAELARKGETLRALILDAVGSASVEAGAVAPPKDVSSRRAFVSAPRRDAPEGG